MGNKVEQNLTAEQCKHIAERILGWESMPEKAQMIHVHALINDGMYQGQSNLIGLDWYEIFEYLGEQGIDMDQYSRKKRRAKLQG